MEYQKFREKIVPFFIERGGRANYQEVQKEFGDDTSRPDYHLNLAVEEGILKRIKGRGNYALNPKALITYRRSYNIVVPVAVIGCSENYRTTSEGLKALSILPKKYVAISYENMDDPADILTKLEDLVEDIVWDLEIIVDIAGSVPLVIALMQLCHEYGLKRFFKGSPLFS